MRLKDLQEQMVPWQNHNFPNRTEWMPLLGVGEELGELNHAFLKKAQGIRGDAAKHDEAMKDAVADIIIFLADFCNGQGIDMETELTRTWNEVRKRDWQANPDNAAEVAREKSGD